MKTYKTFHELKNAPTPVFKHVCSILLKPGQAYAEIQAQAAKAGISDEEHIFEWILGGYPKVLEVVADLDEIETFIEHPTQNRWLTLRETSDVFDAIDVLEDGWVAVMNITNNSGGPMYYIPNWMKLHCSFIQQSIDLVKDDVD
jgi:hypothetical protein